MYDFFNALSALALIAIAIVGTLFYKQYRKDTAPDRKHRATKRALGYAGNVDVERSDVRESARATLRFLQIPDVEAGSVIYSVPNLNPLAEGEWQQDQPVLTTSRIKMLTKNGDRTMELIELMGGYALLATGNHVLLLKRYNLTGSQESYLEGQRKDVVGNDDEVIENFLGREWQIKMAAGDNGPGTPCSKIQVLTTHPRLGESGFKSVLPPGAV